MIPSTSQLSGAEDGLHVAIVMDGNGRWATRRGLPHRRGHEAGAQAVRGIVECAPALGVRLLTLYAFSADNWKRPPREVGALLALFRRYLESECARCVEQGIRLSIIGRRDRLPASLLRAIERTEEATAGGTAMHLRIAIDYSGRAAIAEAARLAALKAEGVVSFRVLLAEAQHRRGRARRGPAHPHRRRAAAERFPAMGMRVCRAAVRAAAVARVRAARPRRRDSGLPVAAAPLRGTRAGDRRGVMSGGRCRL